MVYTNGSPLPAVFAKPVIRMGLGNGENRRPPEGKMFPRGKP